MAVVVVVVVIVVNSKKRGRREGEMIAGSTFGFTDNMDERL